jgi:hypothetical protein
MQMSVTQTPAPARSDLATATPTGPSTTARPFRLHGSILTAGAIAWSAAILAFGVDPGEKSLPLIGFGLGSGLFQVGVLYLLRVLYRTRALGTGKVARALLRIEAGFLMLAIGSTLVDMLGISDLTKPGWLLLDAFWPISMLGMFLIGIRVAIAGRWKGASRFWPMVAESWAVVTVPSLGLFGAAVAQWVGALHLLVGYAVLGQIVARKSADGQG